MRERLRAWYDDSPSLCVTFRVLPWQWRWKPRFYSDDLHPWSLVEFDWLFIDIEFESSIGVPSIGPDWTVLPYPDVPQLDAASEAAQSGGPT